MPAAGQFIALQAFNGLKITISRYELIWFFATTLPHYASEFLISDPDKLLSQLLQYQLVFRFYDENLISVSLSWILYISNFHQSVGVE